MLGFAKDNPFEVLFKVAFDVEMAAISKDHPNVFIVFKNNLIIERSVDLFFYQNFQNGSFFSVFSGSSLTFNLLFSGIKL